MSDQPGTLAILDQFFRSFARPDLDRRVEERMVDVRRLEQRLDEIHVLIERHEARGLSRRLESSRYKHEDVLAARSRLRGYLAGLDESIERIVNRPAKESLQEHSMDLRRLVEDLAAPLDIAGRRLNRYAQRVANGTPALKPRTSAGTEER